MDLVPMDEMKNGGGHEHHDHSSMMASPEAAADFLKRFFIVTALLVPLAIFLWIPGVIWVAEKIYQWVSRNRHLLSRLFGCREACSILPARKRAHDNHLD